MRCTSGAPRAATRDAPLPSSPRALLLEDVCRSPVGSHLELSCQRGSIFCRAKYGVGIVPRYPGTLGQVQYSASSPHECTHIPFRYETGLAVYVRFRRFPAQLVTVWWHACQALPPRLCVLSLTTASPAIRTTGARRGTESRCACRTAACCSRWSCANVRPCGRKHRPQRQR